MAAESAKNVRQLVFFQGHVQGVGFRFTTRRVAAHYDVQGYVRNLTDGRVEMVVEGTSAEISRLIQHIERTMAGHIQSKDVHISEATGEFRGFEIR